MSVFRWFWHTAREWWFCYRYGFDHEWEIMDDDGSARCEVCGCPGVVETTTS